MEETSLGQKKRILIADEDEDWLAFCKETFNQYETVCVHHPCEVFDRIILEEENFDLLVLENTLDRPNVGSYLLGCIRAHEIKTPVVIVADRIHKTTEELIRKNQGTFVRKSKPDLLRLRTQVEALLSL